MRSRGAQVLVVLVALLGGLVAVGAVSPAQAHEERPAGFPDGTGHRPSYAGLDNPRHRVVCTRDSARRIRHMKAGALKRRNRALLKECRFGSIQTAIDSIKRRHTSVYVLPGYYTESRWANAEALRLLLAPVQPVQGPAAGLGVHRQPHRPGRRREEVRPDRAVLRRPATVPAQPEPDRDHGRPHARQRLDPLRQRGLRHPARRDRRHPGRRRHRQPVQEAQRDPGRPRRRRGLPQLHRPAVGVQRALRARDRRLRHRQGDRARQRRVRHPRVRLRPRADPAHQRLLQRRLRHLPRLGLRPQRRQHQLHAGPLRHRDPAQPQPPQHARLQRHGRQLRPRARQRVLRQRHRHRHGLALPRPPGPPPGPRPVGPQPDLRATTRTGTRSTSTRVSATSR